MSRDPMELVGRLENGSDRFLKWSYKEPYSGAPVISIPRHPDNIDALLTEAAACIREMVEKREGLEEDLYQAVLVAYRRGAREWARLNYSALASRLEAAEVGSRELDGAIEEIFDLWRASFTEPEKADCRHCWTDLATWSGEGVVHHAPPYTTSLDSTLALVERVLPGCRIALNSDPDRGPLWAAQVKRRGETWRPIGELATTPSLALVIALLRAKQGEG